MAGIAWHSPFARCRVRFSLPRQPLETDERTPQLTVVPNSLPTPAVTAIARAPQNATRAAPTTAPAPPARAAIAPSATRHSNDTIDTTSGRSEENTSEHTYRFGSSDPAS